MLERHAILIVEDDEIQAMDLAAMVEDVGGEVIGPVATVAEALALLNQQQIAGAVLDANLLDRNVTPVALQLIDLAVPFVIHTGIGLPDELAAAFPHVSVIMKPSRPETVVRQLFDQIADLRQRRTGAAPSSATDDMVVLDEQVDRIATALHDQFGDKAMVIAHRQSVGAIGAVHQSWSAIMIRLEQMLSV